MMNASRMTAAGFGREHFGGARLGDVRRERRLVTLATQMAKHPGGSLPDTVNSVVSHNSRIMGSARVMPTRWRDAGFRDFRTPLIRCKRRETVQ